MPTSSPFLPALRRRALTGFFVVLALCCAIATKLTAQLSTRATITGTVSDSTGAVVPDATVTFTDEGTKVAIKTESNKDGSYNSPGLAVSTYTVSISKTGFKTYTVTGIELHPTEVVQVNGTLPVGSASDTVTVQGTSTDVELSTAENSSYISGDSVSSLPINGRNYSTLAGRCV